MALCSKIFGQKITCYVVTVTSNNRVNYILHKHAPWLDMRLDESYPYQVCTALNLCISYLYRHICHRIVLFAIMASSVFCSSHSTLSMKQS